MTPRRGASSWCLDRGWCSRAPAYQHLGCAGAASSSRSGRRIAAAASLQVVKDARRRIPDMCALWGAKLRLHGRPAGAVCGTISRRRYGLSGAILHARALPGAGARGSQRALLVQHCIDGGQGLGLLHLDKHMHGLGAQHGKQDERRVAVSSQDYALSFLAALNLSAFLWCVTARHTAAPRRREGTLSCLSPCKHALCWLWWHVDFSLVRYEKHACVAPLCWEVVRVALSAQCITCELRLMCTSSKRIKNTQVDGVCVNGVGGRTPE